MRRSSSAGACRRPRLRDPHARGSTWPPSACPPPAPPRRGTAGSPIHALGCAKRRARLLGFRKQKTAIVSTTIAVIKNGRAGLMIIELFGLSLGRPSTSRRWGSSWSSARPRQPEGRPHDWVGRLRPLPNTTRTLDPWLCRTRRRRSTRTSRSPSDDTADRWPAYAGYRASSRHVRPRLKALGA